MKLKIILFLLIPIFLLASNNWPSLQGNFYFTGNNDEIVPKQSKLQWIFQGNAGLLFPIPSGNKIFISSMDHHLYCLDIATGKQQWKYNASYPIIKSPVVYDNYVFLTSGQNIITLDTRTGQIIWKRNETPHYITISPILYKNKIYYATREKVICRALDRGNLLWSKKIPVYGGTATAFDNMIFIHSRQYLNQLFQIFALSSLTGKEIWRKEIKKGILIFTPVIYNNKIYIGTKNLLYCFNAYTGHTLWTRNFPDTIISEVAFNNQSLFLTTESGTFYQINPKTGNTIQYFSFNRGKNYFALVGESGFLLDRKTDILYKIDFHNKTFFPFYKFHLNSFGHYFSIAKGNLYVPLNKKLYSIGNSITPMLIERETRTITATLSPNIQADILLQTSQFQKQLYIDDNGRFNVPIPKDEKKASLYISSQGYQYVHIPITNQKKLQIQLSPIQKSQTFVFHNIYFDYNRAEIKEKSIPLLNNITEYLTDNSHLKIQINGYTDNIGSSEYNMDLSIKRAEKIKEFLVKNGIDKNRLSIKGYGENNPIASNSTEKGRARNRRIEFFLTQK